MPSTPSIARAYARRRGRRTSLSFSTRAFLSALVAAAFAVANGAELASASSFASGSGSDAGVAIAVPRPQNDADVARVPMEVATNASGSLASDNETITFESLLLTPDNMLHLQQLASPETPTPTATVIQQPTTTTKPTASPIPLPSLSPLGTTESPPPVVEAHGVPSPPTDVTAAAFDGSAEVAWKVPDDDGLDPILEYEVAWLDALEGNVVGTQVVTAAPTASPSTAGNATAVPTATTVPSLVNGRSYAFKVRAKNVNGYSTWSAKSLAVSPLHPPDLCGRVACSGHGTCFPIYQAAPTSDRWLTEEETTASSTDARCICRPGFNPPDCSVKNDETLYVWKVSEWGECDSGCGGGQRTRTATCWDVALDKSAGNKEELCREKKPSLTRICNGMECGSKLVSVRYQVETSFDEVLFSPEAWDAFELAFTTEVAASLLIPRTRLEVTAIRRGSIVVFFQILPASRVGEPSLNDIVERLQTELANATSTLRSHGTFARRVETTGVKLSFSIADDTVAGGAEDISIAGLIGTVFVLCLFVALFGLFLRKRHERIMKASGRGDNTTATRNVLNARRSELKPMGIRTMA